MTAPFGWVRTPYGLQRDYILEGYIAEQQALATQAQSQAAAEWTRRELALRSALLLIL
jgi:hypothetical protein